MVQVCLWGPRVKTDGPESLWLKEHVTEDLVVQLDSADFICFGTGCVPLFSIMQPVLLPEVTQVCSPCNVYPRMD